MKTIEGLPIKKLLIFLKENQIQTHLRIIIPRFPPSFRLLITQIKIFIFHLFFTHVFFLLRSYKYK